MSCFLHGRTNFFSKVFGFFVWYFWGLFVVFWLVLVWCLSFSLYFSVAEISRGGITGSPAAVILMFLNAVVFIGEQKI